MGHEFRLSLLTRIIFASTTGRTLLELLDETQRAGIIESIPGDADAFRFVDAGIRDAVYRQIANVERVRLHLAAARAIEECSAGALEPHFAELAQHFAQTGVPEDSSRAVDYALKAARRFTARHEPDGAVSAYELARTVLLRSVPDPEQHCEILLGLATAQRRAGHKLPARATAEQAAELARQLDRPDLLARAALAYGNTRSWGEVGVVNDTLTSLLEESLERLPAAEHALRARLQAGLTEELYHLPPDHRQRPIRDALAAARRARDPAVLAHALLSRRFALWTPDNAEQRRSDTRDAATLARKARDLELAARATAWLASDLLELGLVREADLQIQALSKLAQRLNQPDVRCHEIRLRSTRAAMLGRFDDAERLATEALNIGQALQDPDASLLYAAQIFALRWLQGRLGEIEAVARAITESMQNVWIWRVGLATISAATGNLADARHAFDHLARNDFIDLQRDGHWLTAVALLAEVCATLGDVARAGALYDLLAPFAARHVVVFLGMASAGSASYYLGLLAATLGQWSIAVRHLEAALKMNKDMQAVPHVAKTEHALAAALIGRSRGNDAQHAATLLASAIATYDRLGMHAHVAQARAVSDGTSVPHAMRSDSSPIFILDGEDWLVTWRDTTLKVKDVNGLRVIAHLVRHPRRRFHVTELAPVADAVAQIDESPRVSGLSAQRRQSLRWQSFWHELHRLEWETIGAERRGDRSAARAFRRKTTLMRKTLAQGKAAEVERIRKRIGRNLTTAFDNIGTKSEALKVHLARTINPGFKEVTYDPDADQAGQENR